MLTRWGSNYGMISSILRTKEALQRYGLDGRSSLTTGGTSLINVILSRDFWVNVETIEQILQPVHEVQKMSESCKSHLGHVLQRWNTIDHRWLAMRRSGQFPQVEMIYAGDHNSIWRQRSVKQQTDLTWLAWALDPGNSDRSNLPAGRIDNMLSLLKKHTAPEQHTEVVEDFFAFRDCDGKFGAWREFWKEDYVKKPVLFWKVVSGEAPSLSAMAIRVFSTPANSVPSERSFSAMNFLQDEYRSRLSAERTDMLTFIYMNSKVLRRQPTEPAPTWYNITEEQEEELENLAYEYLCHYGRDSGEDESSEA